MPVYSKGKFGTFVQDLENSLFCDLLAGPQACLKIINRGRAQTKYSLCTGSGFKNIFAVPVASKCRASLDLFEVTS